MGQFRVEETIERPIEEVFSALTDWSRAGTWMGTGALVPGEGPVGEGATLRFEARGSVHETVVVGWEPPKRVALQSVQGGMTAVYEYRCEPRESRTRVSLDARCWGTGALWKLLAPLIGFAMKRSDSRQLAKLKAMVESDTPAAG